MKAHIYMMECITDLHCGKASENYEPIDNLVQRDGATGLPCIYSSALHGAIREFIFHEWVRKPYKFNSEFEITLSAIIDWLKLFGKESSDTNNVNDFLKNNFPSLSDKERKDEISDLFNLFPSGAVDILQGDLLSLSLQSSHGLFVNASTKWIIQNLRRNIVLFELNLNKWMMAIDEIKDCRTELPLNLLFNSLHEGSIKESFNVFTSANTDNIQRFLGPKPALITEEQIRIQCDDFNLPNQARNILENGESKNVWFEQFIPRFSRFFTFIFTPKDSLGEKFHESLHNKIVQIGADATIGRGLVLFTKIFENDRKV
ncbi:MAG: hypothetical protein IPL31_17510 [Saprospiraceae bacterium]|nr:hypothetical protein [Saprospiraceae bacterium]